MNILQPLPLTAEAFASFGEVIQCEDAYHFPINGGTTERFHDLARIEPGPDGRIIVSIFRGQPHDFPLAIRMVERHALSSQAFIPLQCKPYMVVVAEYEPGAERPGRLHAFVARGNQGVNYRPGVWHHPLIAVGEVSDFLVIDRQGNSPDCKEFSLPESVLLDFSL